jgi:hypothetical protein
VADPMSRLPLAPGARRLVVVAWALAVLLGLAYLGFRGNENAGLLLVAALACAGLGLLRVLIGLLQAFDGAASGLWGYEQETVVIALSLVSLFTPWRVEISLAGAGVIPGWQSPLAWVGLLALAPSLSRRLRRWEGFGLAVSGLALAGWLAWAGWLLVTPGFSRLHFPFQPLDLVGVGWYLGLAAWVVAVDGAAGRRGWELSGGGGPFAVLPWAAVPGAGLVRLARPALGRVYLLAAAFLVFLLRLTAYTPAEFAYNADGNRLPNPVPRTDALALAALLALFWLATIAHTVRAARSPEPDRRQPRLESGPR